MFTFVYNQYILQFKYMIDQLYTERYRPGTLDDLIVPSRIKSELSKGATLNFLFHGPAGVGKTSAAKILSQGHEVKYIDVSTESSVDIVRTTIETFCSLTSFEHRGKVKIVLLDEFDGASEQFFKALRGTIEKFEKTTRFIATCNYISKIPAPMLDRFTVINFDLLNKEEEKEVKLSSAKKVKTICEANGISIERDAIIQFVEMNFPSIRSMVKKIQSWKNREILEIKTSDIQILNYEFNDLYNMMFSDKSSYELKQFFQTNYSNKIDEVLVAFSNDFIEWLKLNKPDYLEKVLPITIIETCKHQYQKRFVIDPLIVPLSLIFLIRSNLK